MKILVMIKQVPDTATQVKIAADGRAIDTAGITWIISPYDEFAVEEALRIKEKRGQGEVVAVSLGPDRGKEALQMKVDELVRSTAGARPKLMNLEDLGEDQLEALKKEFERLGERRTRVPEPRN